MPKQNRPREQLNTEFRHLSAEEWGKIFSIDWPFGLRTAIANLYAKFGSGECDEVIEFYSNLSKLNAVFRKENLPYRVTSVWTPTVQKWDSRRVSICTVVDPIEKLAA